MIFALKIFPLNVHITPGVMDHVLACISAARDEVISDAVLTGDYTRETNSTNGNQYQAR